MKSMVENDKMEKVISLSKQRGFIFQSSEIYGGLKSAYDYGPLGVELKRNLMNEWWRSMVHEREDVVGLDASIVMHPKVWHASGHLAGFSDPLVDCLISKERFRADKAPRPLVGDDLPIKCSDKGQAKAYQEAILKRFEIGLRREGKTLVGMKVVDEANVGFFEPDATEASRIMGILLEEMDRRSAVRVATALTGLPRNKLYSVAIDDNGVDPDVEI